MSEEQEKQEFDAKVDKLQVDITRLLKAANDLVEVSNQVRKAISDQEGPGVEQVANSFLGDIGNAYAGKVGNTVMATAETANRITEAAQTLADVATEYAKAEANAMGISSEI